MEPAASRFDFPDGSGYTGSTLDGCASGLGVYRGPTGRGSYAGSWRRGYEDSGTYRWPAGNYFQGQWLQGRKHGLGVEMLRGWLYRGEWTQGLKGRYGVRQNTKSGAKYEGSWTFGFQDGYGVETYADGGTYKGQWLRGMRHGYGIRESVSYDLALRYHRQLNSASLPTSPQEAPSSSSSSSSCGPFGDDMTLAVRDRHIEEGRAGGFVLETEDTEQGGPGGGGGRRGRSSLRRALKFIRQRSAGDAVDDPDRGSRRARTPGGSVRSTISGTGGGGGKSPARILGRKEEVVGEDEGDWGSFLTILDAAFQEDIVERYSGEWKNDRRSGYGVCERSDGVRYEGEWLNNAKNGYGVTTLRDGSRIEGKYKRNVLLTSMTDVKTIFTRTARLKEQVERSVNEALKAARTAKEKAEISNARTASARVKAEQAQVEAGRAESLAEAATDLAQKYAGNVSQPGVQIFMNHLPENDFVSTTSVVPIAHAQFKSPSKFRTLFRLKKTGGDPDLLGKATLADLDSSLTLEQTTARFYSTANVRDDQLCQRDLWQPQGTASVPRSFGNALSTERGTTQEGGRMPRGGILGAPQARLSDELFRNPQVPVRADVGNGVNAPRRQEQNVFQEVSLSSSSQIPGGDVSWSQFGSASGAPGGPPISEDSTAWNQRVLNQTGSPEYAPSTPVGRRLARAEIDSFVQQLPSLSPVGSSGDAPLILDPRSAERRKSLPSIVKDGLPVANKKKPEAPTPVLPEPAPRGGSSGVPDRETFVIEDGVRKRVTPVYGPRSPVRALAVEGRAGLPKLYSIETAVDGRGRGSVPDVNAAGNIEVMSRETAYTLSQQRREELMRQRQADEKRGGQIVLRLGDVTDWCARRKMLIVVLAVNYALVTVFYNMIQQ